MYVVACRRHKGTGIAACFGHFIAQSDRANHNATFTEDVSTTAESGSSTVPLEGPAQSAQGDDKADGSKPEGNDASASDDAVEEPVKRRAGKQSKVETKPPRLPHIIPSFSWLVGLAIRLVTEYGMPRPCSNCVYNTLYLLFENASEAGRVLERKVICPCALCYNRIRPEKRVRLELPEKRVKSVPEDLRKIAEAVGAVVLGKTPRPPCEKRTGPDAK